MGCKWLKGIFKNLDENRINSYIVGCKFFSDMGKKIAAGWINSYIVGCKFSYSFIVGKHNTELIVT